MPDPQTQTSILQIVAAAVVAMVGTLAGKSQWDKRRRNDGINDHTPSFKEVERIAQKVRDELVIVEDRGHREIEVAIRDEGKQSRAAVGRVVDAINAMHIDIVKQGK